MVFSLCCLDVGWSIHYTALFNALDTRTPMRNYCVIFNNGLSLYGGSGIVRERDRWLSFVFLGVMLVARGGLARKFVTTFLRCRFILPNTSDSTYFPSIVFSFL